MLQSEKSMKAKNYAVYTNLGYDIDGQKDILGCGLTKAKANTLGCKYLMN